MEYIFEGKAKKNTIMLMGIGVLLLVIGAIAMAMGHHEGESHLGQRIWTSIFISGFFFFGVSLAALFFSCCTVCSRSWLGRSI